MKLQIEEPSRKTKFCSECGSMMTEHGYYIYKEGTPFCVAWVEDHNHDERELFFDVAFGTWTGEGPFGDHFTFSCRYGPDSPGSKNWICSLKQTPKKGDLIGKRLSVETARSHPMLSEFWGVVDFILANDGEELSKG